MARKNQAEHNESACRYLHSSKKFHDWVITTAFYSAIHYIDACLFPDNFIMPDGKTKNCHSIDDYYSKSSFQNEAKHEIRMRLVEDNCTGIQASFKWLKENSGQLRYFNYKATLREAVKAIEYLEEIKAFFEVNHK